MRKSVGIKTYIMPQPVMVLGTYNDDNTANAMTAAWSSIYDDTEVFVCLGDHKTNQNLVKRNSFTLHVTDSKTILQADYLGIISGDKDPNKVTDTCGLTVIKSDIVDAPIFDEFPVCLECEVKSFVDGKLIGYIKNVSIKEDVLGADGLPDLNKFKPVAYDPVHHEYIEMGGKIAQAFSDGLKLKK